MSITNILSPIMINIDRFFISSFLGANSVALYTLPFEIITKVLLFAGALGATLLPKLSQEFEVNKAKAIVSVGKSVWIVSGVSVSSLILAASFGEEALRIFAGPEFGKTSYTVLIIISLGVIFNGIAYIYYTALHSLGDAKKTATVHIVEFLVYLPAAYWLISSYGIIAAALLWATRALVDMLILYYVFKRRIAGV
jgi:O-antigen/teichoic acid export membrane protein